MVLEDWFQLYCKKEDSIELLEIIVGDSQLLHEKTGDLICRMWNCQNLANVKTVAMNPRGYWKGEQLELSRKKRKLG